ncbi:MAG TPA: carbonic anhydrase [Methanomassiliicoccales archaeon]|nr:carbonic anhydrase [Methanomassiliicoccales archaeon]
MPPAPPCVEDGSDLFIDNLKRGNERWRASYPGQPRFNGSAKAVILTCMDSRIPPLEMLGLSPGEVFIVRNAGNSVTADALRSLIICLTIMECRKVLVVGHSQCGMSCPTGLDDRVIELVDEEELIQRLGTHNENLRDWFGFHHLTDEEWVLRQVGELRFTLKKVLPRTEVDVLGAIYHLEDGRLDLL